MSDSDHHPIDASRQSCAASADQLFALAYNELRCLAAAKLALEDPGQTLQPTALVHEAYLRLLGNGQHCEWQSRSHFFSAIAQAMRRILIDLARKKRSLRGGGRRTRRELIDEVLVALPINDELLELDDALRRFQDIDSAAAEVVKLRVFAGMSIDEVAEALGVSPRTVKRNWAYARAWLRRELGADSNA